MSAQPPRIFSEGQRLAVRRRARGLCEREPSVVQFILQDMVEDVIERLAFLRHDPRRALAIGERTGELERALAGTSSSQGSFTAVHPEEGFDEVAPYAQTGFDLIASFATLDTVNDLPGALIHMRNALAPGGLAIASFVGGASLQRLRHAMMVADGERPAARMHPLIDHRSCPQLLQRAGWKDPVVDFRRLDVRYPSFDLLLSDLRSQAMTRVLASPVPRLTRAQRALAAEAFMDGQERVTETFEIITLTGRRSLAGT